MTKLDYLKFALQNQLHYSKPWITSAFSVTSANKKSYIGQLVRNPWGFSYLNENSELVEIENTKDREVLFTFKDTVTIDPTWIPNAQQSVETTIGNILFNAICIIPAFGSAIPFQLGQVSVSKVENLVIPLLTDTPLTSLGDIDENVKRDPSKIYVDQYIKFTDSLQFLSNLSQLTTWSATPKALVEPTGLKEFKQHLIEKYKGKLNDPVELSKFEQELLDFDNEFLKDDPAYGTFLKGKILHTARKKMFLAMGADRDFTDSLEITPVINSLQDGWPTDPKEFTALLNGSRVGSFSRGAETVKGGVSAKILLRAGNNYEIKDTDCQSTLGITRIFTDKTINKLVGRYLLKSNKPILIENEEQARSLINSKILLRSPMYCKLGDGEICRVCAGEKLFKFPTGVTIPLTEISSIILATSLKAMHQNTLSTAKLDLQQHFS